MSLKETFDKKRVAGRLLGSPILLVIIAMAVLSAAFVPNFATLYNLKNLLLQTCDLLIISLGVTFTVLNGGLDFSSTSVLALSSVVGAYIMALSPLKGTGLSILLAIVVMVAIGAAVGAINGFSVVKLKMPSFIVTLSTQLFFSGMAIYFTSKVTDKASIMGLPSAFYRIGGEKAFFLPIVIAAAVFLVSHWLMTRTISSAGMCCWWGPTRNPATSRASTSSGSCFCSSCSAGSTRARPAWC